MKYSIDRNRPSWPRQSLKTPFHSFTRRTRPRPRPSRWPTGSPHDRAAVVAGAAGAVVAGARPACRSRARGRRTWPIPGRRRSGRSCVAVGAVVDLLTSSCRAAKVVVVDGQHVVAVVGPVADVAHRTGSHSRPAASRAVVGTLVAVVVVHSRSTWDWPAGAPGPAGARAWACSPWRRRWRSRSTGSACRPEGNGPINNEKLVNVMKFTD